ncbi:hypothetical protein HHK36_003920 [Tetracentron sinense]|uniref:J domain-containing protein n=1 Tax=Tetracentron sinense TaxID=13715 RepID=A0A834ZQ79_TETSI|nr:hypothetical protein HHK36_003920 [Tetracentron sinense]
MEGSSNRAEAKRWLGIAEKLLMDRDLVGSKRFAIRAQDSDPLLDGPDQILAVAEVILAGDNRINNHFDWYAILQIERQSEDLELIKKQYRRLALFLNPVKNKFPLADNAFKLVSDAWAVLSNPSKKSLYDNELTLFSKFDLIASENEQQQEQSLNRSPRKNKRVTADEQKNGSGNHSSLPQLSSFWTACPYCYILYEYPRVYEESCLRCQNCQRAFHAASIPSPPPVIPGKKAYFCCWGFFPLGFSAAHSESDKNTSFPSSMSFSSMFPCPQPEEKGNTAVPKTGLDDQDSLIEIPDQSGESSGKWGSGKKRRSLNSKEGASLNGDLHRSVAENEKGNILGQEMKVPKIALKRKKTVAKKAKRQIGEGRRRSQEKEELDLNELVGNEVENLEPAMAEGMRAEINEEDVNKGTDFFEGLDEFLDGLPIFSVVGEEKTDKATLLAEVVQHVKELKKIAAGAMEKGGDGDREWPFPVETDELTLGYCECEGESRRLIRASLCCDDRQDLLSDLTHALRSVRVRVLKAELATVAGRTKSVFVIEEREGGDDDLGRLRRVLKGVVDKPALSSVSGQVLPGNKRSTRGQ